MIKVNGVYVEVNGFRVTGTGTVVGVVDRGAEMVKGAIKAGRGGLAKSLTMDLVKVARNKAT